MPQVKISNDLKYGCYFLTPTIKNWYYIFDRYERWQILADSLKYCQTHKGLEIFAYVFMLNHLHMIVRSEDVPGFLREFKTFTSKQLKINLQKHEPKVLELFYNDKGAFNFWKNDNAPKFIDRDHFFTQKLNYIHDNPVKKGYVERPEHWKWSSANPNSEISITSHR